MVAKHSESAEYLWARRRVCGAVAGVRVAARCCSHARTSPLTPCLFPPTSRGLARCSRSLHSPGKERHPSPHWYSTKQHQLHHHFYITVSLLFCLPFACSLHVECHSTRVMMRWKTGTWGESSVSPSYIQHMGLLKSSWNYLRVEKRWSILVLCRKTLQTEYM